MSLGLCDASILDAVRAVHSTVYQVCAVGRNFFSHLWGGAEVDLSSLVGSHLTSSVFGPKHMWVTMSDIHFMCQSFTSAVSQLFKKHCREVFSSALPPQSDMGVHICTLYSTSLNASPSPRGGRG